jgi:glycosyltransferase involved in cell wall biosynthesis
MPTVDIVIPCYNYGRFLKGCVNSVLDQQGVDVRVLIIDDTSKDDSVAVAKELAADSRVTVIAHPTNKGHIRTYNEGIDWASSEYFLLLSADDLLVPGALARAVTIMEENPDVVLTHGRALSWHDHTPMPEIDEVQPTGWHRQDLLKEMCTTSLNFVFTPTAVARTSVQKAIGGYRPSLPHAGDMEMWLRFAARGKVANIDAIQAIYRKHSTAMSNSYLAEMISDYRQCDLAFTTFFDENDERLGPARELRGIAKASLADRVFDRGIRLLRRGRLRTGVSLVREAMTMNRRLRYLPPLWRLLKPPGKDGRAWALSFMR